MVQDDISLHVSEAKERGDDKMAEESLFLGLKRISEQISNWKREMKSDLLLFKEDLKQDMKAELGEFKKKIILQLKAADLASQEQKKWLEEAETWIEGLDTWSDTCPVTSTVVNKALQQALKKKKLVDNVHDLESRSRWNNLRIYGAEGSLVIQFVKIKSCLVRTQPLRYSELIAPWDPDPTLMHHRDPLLSASSSTKLRMLSLEMPGLLFFAWLIIFRSDVRWG